MFRAVLDVNVLVSAAIRLASVPGSVVTAWRAGYFEPVVSPKLLAELRDVLERPDVARYLTPIDAEELIAEIERIATVVDDPSVSQRLVPGDPDDDYLVALAHAGRAHVIVTGDSDLLEADIVPPAVSPREFLMRLAELDR